MGLMKKFRSENCSEPYHWGHMKTYLYAKGNPVLVTIHEVLPNSGDWKNTVAHHQHASRLLQQSNHSIGPLVQELLILTQTIDRKPFRLLFLSHDLKDGTELDARCLDEEHGTPQWEMPLE